MRRLFQDSGHLIRPALVLLAAVGVFLMVRAAVVPKDFGKYGHYRPAALDLVRQHPMAYAGQDTCVMCHDEEAKARAAGKHAHVACEACHGPLAQHADDPSPTSPNCPTWPTSAAAAMKRTPPNPAGFPQVATAEHSGGMLCNDCHQPHNPHL